MEDKPNYYSVIPAIVRYDNELKPNEKLLYGEISALTNRNGECWASNDYFAKLYDKSKDTVSDWISMLNKKRYISVELIRNETTKAIEKRIIRINPLLANIDLVPVKSPIGYRQKSLEGIGKKTEENNTSINNTSINIKEINPKTMESKKIKGLYFAGEIIDVDAYTGGFNLQIAYSTGYVAGMTHEGQV